jgi:predicted DNA-binding transcriptional regulator AlpA
MDITQLHTDGFLRLWHIIGSKKKGVQPLIPMGKSTWHDGVKSGRFPKPIKLGPRTTAWRAKDILALVESLEKGCFQ